jgi:hypothetical protein
MRILKAGALYFAIVFGTGFVLGPIRILWAVPRYGARVSELMESPIMFVVTIVAARWIVRRLALPSTPPSRLGMGCVALCLLLVAEFTLVLWLRGLSISEYLASRDPVSGTVYYIMLGVFAIMYQESETPEVFTWTPMSNNQAMLAGRASYVVNDISITRFTEREHLPIDSKIMISQALKGPVRRIAPVQVMDCYVIWEFAENKEGAQQFLIDYIDVFHDGFIAGQFCNFPCFPSTCPSLKKEISNDPIANPPDKYKVLDNVLDWTTNVGYPGYTTAAIDVAFATWVIPTMFAKVARGDETPENAAKAAEEEYKRIFARWA